jgi:hypothetical protein
MVYDRDDDEDLPWGAIERAIKEGDVTLAEIVRAFRVIWRNCWRSDQEITYVN